MAPPVSLEDERFQRASLLAEAIDLTLRELRILSENRWDDVPGLKREKTILASRFRAIDWSARVPDMEPNWKELSSLENRSRQKIEDQLELVHLQMTALQELHQYWLECLNISFEKFRHSLQST
jgi:hypothetical protein